jgi:hypothetical protein
MAVSSLVLAALALFSIVLAIPTTPIPGVGAFFAFGAPVLAFAGVVLGGVALSRRKRQRQATSLALAGVIVSVLSLLPAMFTAVTFGLLNVLFSVGPVQVQRSFQMHVQSGGTLQTADAGRPAPPANEPAPAPAPPSVPGAPPPAFPPPPLK